MKIKDYSILGKHTFLDLQMKSTDKIPDIVRIFDQKNQYTHYLYADFKETNV